MNRWALIVLVQILTMVGCTSAQVSVDTVDDPQNYCSDVQAWAEWKNLIDKYPEDDDLRAAYALRLGLCLEVKEHTIDTKRAIAIFDRFMTALKWQTIEQERKQKLLQEKGI